MPSLEKGDCKDPSVAEWPGREVEMRLNQIMTL